MLLPSVVLGEADRPGPNVIYVFLGEGKQRRCRHAVTTGLAVFFAMVMQLDGPLRTLSSSILLWDELIDYYSDLKARVT